MSNEELEDVTSNSDLGNNEASVTEEPSKSTTKKRANDEVAFEGKIGHGNNHAKFHSENEQESDTDDEYDLSDDMEMNDAENHPITSHNMSYHTISDHTKYFSDTIAQAMDSIELDKTLAAQTRLSGELNYQNQQLVEKKKEVLEKFSSLQKLYNNFYKVKGDSATSQSKVDKIYNDIITIEKKLDSIENGSKSMTAFGLFGSSNNSRTGVQQQYPVEYNQAYDKVVDRQFDID